jgi:ATP-dependent Clp protease ATP-binding subunit ClpB
LDAEYLTEQSLCGDEQTEKVLAVLKQSFKPEFINRIDDIVVFKRLTKDNIKAIADLALKNIENRLKDRNITLALTDKALQWVVDNGYDEVYGARPLKRLLKKELENKLAYAILSGAIKDGDTVNVDVNGEGLVIGEK